MLSFLILHGKKRVEEVSKSLSARGDGSGRWKRRDEKRMTRLTIVSQQNPGGSLGP